MNFKNYHLLLLAVFSGVLLSLAWTQWSMGIVLFIGFIPLLFIEDHLDRNRHIYRSVRMFLYSYLAFFTWNLISTWWIYHASPAGMAMAVICNSLFMAIVFWIFHISKRKLGPRLGYFGLLVFWLAFEHIHLRWELSWPWLILGNGFANNIRLIQWYEYTGALGGSLWALTVNIAIFALFRQYVLNNNKRAKRLQMILLVAVIAIPLLISYIQFYSYEEKKAPYNVVAIQPNIDPYNEKFGGLSPMQQLNIILTLADTAVDNTTDFLVAPETSLDYPSMWEKYDSRTGRTSITRSHIPEDTIEADRILMIKRFLEDHGKINFVFGMSSRKMYEQGEPVPSSARKFMDADIYYDAYNTAVLIDKTFSAQLYHKSKLVLGVEKMPFKETLSFLDDFAIDLGGTTKTLGIQEDRATLKPVGDTLQIGTLICYESVFGQFVTGFIKNGAHIIFVITNDGWWRDTPGYRQHLSYSCLRAIETRRSIARSANTGISCFINQRGEIIKPTDWWVPTVIKETINANDKITFYVVFGDFIGRISCFLAVFVLLYTIVKGLMPGNKVGSQQ